MCRVSYRVIFRFALTNLAPRARREETSGPAEERGVQSVWKYAARFVFVIFAANLRLIPLRLAFVAFAMTQGEKEKKKREEKHIPVGGLGAELRIFARPSSHRGVAQRYE